MADQQGQQTRLKAVLRHPTLRFVGKFIKAAPASRDSNFMNCLA